MNTASKVEDELMVAKLENYQNLYPEISEITVQIAQQHNKLYELITLDSLSAAQVRELAVTLYEHIRFEERELFPLAQSVLSEQELDAIYAARSEHTKHESGLR